LPTLRRIPFTVLRGEADAATQRLLRDINQEHARQRPGETLLESRIAAAELAAGMQLAAPEAFDIARESAETQSAYGLDQPETADFGRRCLLARRLIERGTRFVQVWSGPQAPQTTGITTAASRTNSRPLPAASISPPPRCSVISNSEDSSKTRCWSGAPNLAARRLLRAALDVTTIAGLSSPGWPERAFSAAATHGLSDELGYQTAEGRTTCHDLYATILHLMGIDHKRLTFRTSGIDRRLTDVHGRVVSQILSHKQHSG
jgi:hypothetical protein